MPNGHEAEEVIRLAEAHGLEASEHLIARELFPGLNVLQRSLLVAWKLRPDDPHEDILHGAAIEGTEAEILGEQMRASGLFRGLTPLQQAILHARYGIVIPPGWS